MGIQAKPCGKWKSVFQKIENEQNKERERNKVKNKTDKKKDK